jgi:hypothetical protein
MKVPILIENTHITGKISVLILMVDLAVTFWCFDLAAAAGVSAEKLAADTALQEKTDAEVPEYHTLLAGEQREASFFGKTVLVPALDRSSITSLTLGGSYLDPRQGGTRGLPVFALYLSRIREEYRTRDMISLFVNELEYDKRLGHFELIGHFENFTLPEDRTEVVDNREINQTSVTYGSLIGSLGPGLRFQMPPYQVDNDFRVQLLGRLGYFYAGRTHDTGPGLEVPPDTPLYGARLRGRYDGMRRNLLELPHEGLAAGWDLDFMHRDKWRDLAAEATGSIHRNYLQVSGYLVGAGGIPGLSERDRVLISLHGGKTGKNGADRFNSFRINGGPFPCEADDLARIHYSGILYEDILATSYATASLGYRRELAFFLYLSVVGSYLWSNRTTVVGADQVVFRDQSGEAATVSLDTAFFWNSELYLGFAWESGVIRAGKSGSGVIVNWNKSF